MSPLSPPLSPLIPSPDFTPYEIESLLGIDADDQLNRDMQNFIDDQLSTRVETVSREILSPSQSSEGEQSVSTPSTPILFVDDPSSNTLPDSAPKPDLTQLLTNTITISTDTIVRPLYFQVPLITVRPLYFQTPLLLGGNEYLMNPFAYFPKLSQPAQVQHPVPGTPVATTPTLVPVKTEKVSSHPEKPQNSVRNTSVSITPTRVPVKIEQASTTSTTTTSSNIKQNGQPIKYRAILPKPSNMSIAKK